MIEQRHVTDANPSLPTQSVSIVVATKDRPQFLDACLGSVAASIRSCDEVVVVDSASSGPDTRSVAIAHGATYLRCERAGASRARNAGWLAARNDLIAFIDDDVQVDPAWVEAIASCFDRFPDVSFLSGRIDTPDGLWSPSHAAPFFDPPEAFWINEGFTGVPGHGANLAFRRGALAQVGGYDVELGPGARFHAAEDHDLLDRVLAAGLCGRYEPNALVIHPAWRGKQETLGLNWAYGVGAGARLVKLLKTNRQRAKHAVADTVWGWGLRDLFKWARKRHKWLVVLTLVRTAGMFVGFTAAVFRRVQDGHFAPRTSPWVRRRQPVASRDAPR